MVKYIPKTPQEALEYRAQFHPVPFAGGTDLMVKRRQDADYLSSLSRKAHSLSSSLPEGAPDHSPVTPRQLL